MDKKISRLHIITQHIEKRSHLQQIKQLKDSNCDWIQLRVKNTSQEEWFTIGRKAKEIDADGVHLGLNDMDISEAKSILGENKIIGGTANTYEDIINQYHNGVDYIGLGPYAATTTKENLSPVIQFFGYEVIMKKLEINKIDIPIIAIGGIQFNDVGKLLAAGLTGVAISSAIVKTDNLIEHANNFTDKVNSFNFTE